MLDDDRVVRINDALLTFGKTIAKEKLMPTVVPQAEPLLYEDPYAFLIATCLDRGMKAEMVWTIPYDMKTFLGHLDPRRIQAMSLDELDEMFRTIPRKPRYRKAAARTVKELSCIVVEDLDGDAARFWQGKSASHVQEQFQSIYGVGPGIASMGVLLIEQAFNVHFPDRATMTIKPDVHTVRVLYRLGVSRAPDEESAMFAARRLNPDFPGAVDGALWEIGRRWCAPTGPECTACIMVHFCAKRISGEPNNAL
jgi:endonuclease III